MFHLTPCTAYVPAVHVSAAAQQHSRCTTRPPAPQPPPHVQLWRRPRSGRTLAAGTRGTPQHGSRGTSTRRRPRMPAPAAPAQSSRSGCPAAVHTPGHHPLPLRGSCTTPCGARARTPPPRGSAGTGCGSVEGWERLPCGGCGCGGGRLWMQDECRFGAPALASGTPRPLQRTPTLSHSPVPITSSTPCAAAAAASSALAAQGQQQRTGTGGPSSGSPATHARSTVHSAHSRGAAGSPPSSSSGTSKLLPPLPSRAAWCGPLLRAARCRPRSTHSAIAARRLALAGAAARTAASRLTFATSSSHSSGSAAASTSPPSHCRQGPSHSDPSQQAAASTAAAVPSRSSSSSAAAATVDPAGVAMPRSTASSAASSSPACAAKLMGRRRGGTAARPLSSLASEQRVRSRLATCGSQCRPAATVAALRSGGPPPVRLGVGGLSGRSASEVAQRRGGGAEAGSAGHSPPGGEERVRRMPLMWAGGLQARLRPCRCHVNPAPAFGTACRLAAAQAPPFHAWQMMQPARWGRCCCARAAWRHRQAWMVRRRRCGRSAPPLWPAPLCPIRRGGAAEGQREGAVGVQQRLGSGRQSTRRRWAWTWPLA